MDYLVRKISSSRWSADSYLSRPGFVGDIDLTENALSVWKCNREKADINEVVLALTANQFKESFESIDIVFLNKAGLIVQGFVLDETALGDTVVEDLRSRHVDIIQLDAAKIRRLGELIINIVLKKEQQRVAQKDIKAIVQQAVNEGRLDKNKLKEGLREKLV